MPNNWLETTYAKNIELNAIKLKLSLQRTLSMDLPPRKKSNSSTPPTPKRLRPSIRLDPVNPNDFLKYDFIYCCEQCSHFSPTTEKCTLGYPQEPHRRETNLKTYHLNGKMAFCRFLEID